MRAAGRKIRGLVVLETPTVIFITDTNPHACSNQFLAEEHDGFDLAKESKRMRTFRRRGN